MRWHGPVGFTIQGIYNDDPVNHPGAYVNKIVEKKYYGDVNRAIKRWQGSNDLNDDLRLNVQLSILSNKYMTDNLGNIVYVTMHGKKWKVTEIDERYPRVVLTLGGLYNG